VVNKSGREGQKTRENASVRFPYKEFVDTPIWLALDEAISDLVDNNDIKETTARRYIVGYLCKKLAKIKN
jgi:hypothetical protein